MLIDNAGQLVAGRYRLDKILRQTGASTTWAATDEQDSEVVAVKLMEADCPALPLWIEPGSGRTRFDCECALGASLSHPNLVRYRSAFRTPERIGLVTDLVDGEPFLEAICRPDMPKFGQPTRDAFRQLANAIQYLHEQHLVHGNLKPSSILWTDFGLKLVDLGHCTNPTVPDPRVGVLRGTLAYWSPEHWGKPLVYESDYFSVGLLLAEHVLGDAPCHLRRTLSDQRRGPRWSLRGMGEAIAGLLHLRSTSRDYYRDSWHSPLGMGEDMAGLLDAAEIPAHYASTIRTLLSDAPADRRPAWSALVAALEKP